MRTPFFSSLTWCTALATVTLLAACDGSSPSVNNAEKNSAIAQEAPTATPSTESPVSAPSLSIQEMESLVGVYPNSGATGYLETGMLAERIKSLLGNDDYAIFLRNIEVATPLHKDGQRFYVAGNRAHQGGIENAAVVIDPVQNGLKIWLTHDGQEKVFQDPAQIDITWPQDIQISINNYQESSKK